MVLLLIHGRERRRSCGPCDRYFIREPIESIDPLAALLQNRTDRHQRQYEFQRIIEEAKGAKALVPGCRAVVFCITRSARVSSCSGSAPALQVEKSRRVEIKTRERLNWPPSRASPRDAGEAN